MRYLILIYMSTALLLIAGVYAQSASEYRYNYRLGLIGARLADIEKKNISIPRLVDNFYDLNISIQQKDFEAFESGAKELDLLINLTNELDSGLEKISLIINQSPRIGINFDDISLDVSLAYREFFSNNFETSKEAVAKINQVIYQKYSEKSYEVVNKILTLNNSIPTTSIEEEILGRKIYILEQAKKEKDYGLFINTITEIFILEEDLKEIISLYNESEMLKENNIGTNRLNDILFESLYFLNSSGYKSASQKINESYTLLDRIHESYELGYLLENEINLSQEKGTNVTIPHGFLRTGLNEIELENFETAIVNFNEGLDSLSEIEQKELLFNIVSRKKVQSDIKIFFKKYWLLLLILAILMIPISYFLRLYLGVKLLQYKLRTIAVEQKKISKLRKDIQYDYFKNKLIDKKTYSAQIESIDDREGALENKHAFLDLKLVPIKKRYDIIMNLVTNYSGVNRINRLMKR